MDFRTKLLLGVCLPIAIWTAIFFIQVLIGHFMPPILIAVVGGVLGAAIGFWLARQ